MRCNKEAKPHHINENFLRFFVYHGAMNDDYFLLSFHCIHYSVYADLSLSHSSSLTFSIVAGPFMA